MLKTRLADARKYRELTQADLAEKLDMKQSNVSAYERGDRSPKRETLQKIAIALELSLQYRMGEAFFYDPHYDESMPEKDIIEREAFNQLQEASVDRDVELLGFSSPADYEKAWQQLGGGQHNSRQASLARIELNEEKLDDIGVKKLADYSDDLVDSGKYNK